MGAQVSLEAEAKSENHDLARFENQDLAKSLNKAYSQFFDVKQPSSQHCIAALSAYLENINAAKERGQDVQRYCDDFLTLIDEFEKTFHNPSTLR